MTRRQSIAPGSLACRIRSACPPKVGATMRQIERAGLALAEDVREEVRRLRRVGYVRTYGRTSGRRYFWRP